MKSKNEHHTVSVLSAGITFLLGLVVLTALGVARQQATPLYVSTVNRTASNWALYVGLENNYFRDEGIDLQLSVAGSSTRLMSDLLGDQLHVGHMAAGNVIRAVEEGEDLFIAMAVNRPVFSLVVSPEIRTLEQLRGKTVGVDNSRTGYVNLVRALLRRSGIDDDAYSINDVGGVDRRYEALLAGVVDAALLSVPRDIEAVQRGYSVLTTLDISLEEYAGSVAVARRGWAARHGRLFTSYLRAYRKGLQWLYDPANETAAVGILQRQLEISEPTARSIYRDVLIEKEWLPRQGRVRPEGLQAIARQMGIADAGHSGAFPTDRYMDTSFYEAALALDLPK